MVQSQAYSSQTVSIIYDNAVDEKAELLEMVLRLPIWRQKVVDSIKSQLGNLAELIIPKRLGQADLAVSTSNVGKVRKIFPEPDFKVFGENDPIVKFWTRRNNTDARQAEILAIGDVRSNYMGATSSQLEAMNEHIMEWLKLQAKAREDRLKELREF